MAQLSNLIVNGVTRLLSKLYVSDSVTAPNFIGKLTGTAAKLGRNGDADTPMTFNWSGKDGQPTWLWGGENGSDMYVYNPSNFSVKNAKAAGSADSATKLSSSAGSATQPVYFSDGKPVATTYTLGKSVPASAVFTDTNTWRGVQNNLTSDATDQSLSAAQGKVLKGLVDGKAPSGHTHDDRYYTESEIDSKLSGKANNHSHPYLPLAGGTMSGTITFAAIGDKGTSAGLAFSGSTDGAGIYYQTTAGDQGNLVLNLTDDDNCYLQIAKNGAFKSYFSPDGVFHGSVAGNASSASSVAWNNVTGKPSTFTPASHTHSQYYDSTISRTKGTVLAAPASANGVATFRTLTKSDVGLSSVDNTADSAKSVKYATSAGSAGSATKANCVADYNATSKSIQIGYSGDGITGDAIKYIAGYTTGDGGDVSAKIKDISKDALKGWIGSLPANGGNSTTVNGHSINSDVPAGAKFTDTNTWRGIQDNLTSTSTTDSLSANQGKVLKGLIDGKAASGHTHNYAGSSSAGGAATSANKVNAALTINLNGTSQGAWDGSSAKSISITAASVGATSVTISRW